MMKDRLKRKANFLLNFTYCQLPKRRGHKVEPAFASACTKIVYQDG